MLNGIILKELTVSELRNMVEQSFDKNEKGLKRVNKNLKLIRSSLSITNKKFIVYEILMYILIFSYHLVLIGEKRIVEIAVHQKDKKIPVVNLIGGLFAIIGFFIILANIYK